MAEIAVLNMSEGIRVDAGRVLEIYDQLGEAAAEVVLGRAMEELAVALAQLERGHQDGSAGGGLSGLLTQADRIAALAWQVGLTTLARVAADVVACGEGDNHSGFHATSARLLRVANRSLTAIWDVRDVRP